MVYGRCEKDLRYGKWGKDLRIVLGWCEQGFAMVYGRWGKDLRMVYGNGDNDLLWSSEGGGDKDICMAYGRWGQGLTMVYWRWEKTYAWSIGGGTRLRMVYGRKEKGLSTEVGARSCMVYG